jgi:hypothetical protein
LTATRTCSWPSSASQSRIASAARTGALWIVLARDRRAEQRHHGVADELLDRPAPALELVAQPLVVRLQDGLDVLRVEPLSAGREADQVGEEHGHDLPLGGRRGGRLAERRPTLGAELGSDLVLVAAIGAARHE